VAEPRSGADGGPCWALQIDVDPYLNEEGSRPGAARQRALARKRLATQRQGCSARRQADAKP